MSTRLMRSKCLAAGNRAATAQHVPEQSFAAEEVSGPYVCEQFRIFL